MSRIRLLSWLLASAVALMAPTGCQTSLDPPTAGEIERLPHARAPEAAPARVVPTALHADTLDAPPLPDGFVRLGDVTASVAQEMRYATAFNFVGEPIRGYQAPACILTEPAARALAGVARALRRGGLGLKVYDCYRPQTAVTHFAQWTGVPDESMKGAFYPDEPKGRLFSRGYIATRSGHSRGSTVDLTLVRLPAARAVRTRFPDPADGPLPRCTDPVGERLDEGDLDMGTAYDCFSPDAATDSPAVPAAARRNRERLRQAMSDGGFRNYAKEWWHFTLRGEPYTGTYFDFPVQ